MLTYSVAIRTLGLSPDTLRRTLEGVMSQTITPERVIVYIAEGYPRPSFNVGSEEYVWVRKGMLTQRALGYDEIESDVILMLDDDILLSPAAVGRLLISMMTGGYDLLGADVFKNHRMTLWGKAKALITNMVMPHPHGEIAFQLHPSGGFSYISSPGCKVYDSDTVSGPLMMWKKKAFKELDMPAERWIDRHGYPFGEDALISYKARINGYKVGVDFGVEVTNLDARSSSDRYRTDPSRFYTRTLMMTLTWWRMCYKPMGNQSKGSRRALLAGIGKALWLMPVMAATSIITLSHRPMTGFLRAIPDAVKIARDANLPPYKFR